MPEPTDRPSAFGRSLARSAECVLPVGRPGAGVHTRRRHNGAVDAQWINGRPAAWAHSALAAAQASVNRSEALAEVVVKTGEKGILAGWIDTITHNLGQLVGSSTVPVFTLHC